MQISKLLTLGILIISCAAKKSLAQSGIPEKAKKIYVEAMNFYEKGDKAKAISSCDKAIKAYPNYADAYALKAAIFEEDKKVQEADNAYQQSIKCDSFYIPTYFYYAKFLSDNGKYQEALKVIDLADANKERNQKRKISPKIVNDLNNLRGSCKMNILDKTSLESLKIVNMGPKVNSADYEYWPGMTIDGKYFIYTHMSPAQMQEDIFYSEFQNGEWTKAASLPGDINTGDNEGTSTVRADGKIIIFTACNQGDGLGSCDLYYSYTDGINWSKRMNLGVGLNSMSWDAQPSIGPDGKTLIYASGREGGFGGKDLYLSVLKNGKWQAGVNLGPEINTVYDEESPFLHYDGRTLYFSSNGHGGFGGKDILFSRRQDDGTWSKPANIGKYINTDADEVGLYVDRSGEHGYFASDREGGFGGMDIWQFELPKEKRPEPVTWIQGKVIDAETGNPVVAKIELYNLTKNLNTLKDSSKSFFIPVNPNQNFAFNVSKPGYLFYSENFQPTAGTIDSPFTVIAKIKPIKKDIDIVLRNVFFDVDKFDLKIESTNELNSVVALMKNNPNMKIEISGHTDNTGAADHNKVLSENRAKSVVEFLVKNGIDKSRLVASGYGALKPISDNSSDTGKALNRRIEMKVLAI